MIFNIFKQEKMSFLNDEIMNEEITEIFKNNKNFKKLKIKIIFHT